MQSAERARYAFFASRAFCQLAELPVDPVDSDHDHLDLDLHQVAAAERLGSVVTNFADYLLANFFLPLRACSGKTPQLSPVCHSAVKRAQGGGLQHFVGTLERVASLRVDCLIRDRHRCAVSRLFDVEETKRRQDENGREATDDDGNLLADEPRFEFLEVAHILPHSLTSMEKGSEFSSSKKAALGALSIFDHGILGTFDMFFEPVPGQENTYRIQSFSPLSMPDLPVVRTLFLTESKTIEPPSPRLLALHSAIGHIFHLSGGGQIYRPYP
ncbi:hypothetical protein B0H67DRAFT_640511 [Lasiosphaeris hirsuta]|uniref:HNH nuclease domain-containing protein n=1 Tax=Lasiosphaeris hirsuta TaxID=260670 RepID=A0AA40E8I8_9PEZI|nr:hypothetical protein B0H67DRAFT_640511 [Lasiosphaeris hirsuta]